MCDQDQFKIQLLSAFSCCIDFQWEYTKVRYFIFSCRNKMGECVTFKTEQSIHDFLGITVKNTLGSVENISYHGRYYFILFWRFCGMGLRICVCRTFFSKNMFWLKFRKSP